MLALAVWCLTAWLGFDGQSSGAQAAEAPPPQAAEFSGKLAPFIKKYCVDCHSGKEAEAAIDFDKYQTAGDFLGDRKTWRNVAAKLRNHEMPPDDHDTQPTAKELEEATAWIDSTLKAAICNGPIDPGRVTIRRLNRAEYNNTIRDLCGVDFKPADDFPTDDVGYGFDNIGDVLAMPPILLEKYLTAAETIMDKAIAVNDPTKAYTNRIVGKKLTADNGGPIDETEAHLLSSEGEIKGDFNFPRDGEYQIGIEAWGEQAGPDPARMALRIDKQDVKTFDVTNDRFKPRVFQVRQKFTAGNKQVTAAFLNDFYKPKSNDAKNGGDRNLAVGYIEIRGPLELDPEKLSAAHKLIMVANAPTLELDDLAKPKKSTVFSLKKSDEKKAGEQAAAQRRQQRIDAAKSILGRFATRAFRRPVTNDELARLMKLWESGEADGQPFERSVQIACTAVLVSPHFLFRIELDPQPNDPNFVYQLNDFELATRLSYFLWSTMPDDELRGLAERGELRKSGNFETQVKRMMKDPKAQALVDNFGGQWLQTRRLSGLNFDRRKFRNFDERLRAAMLEETSQFFTALLTEDRSILEFLDADFTFLNERLAKQYGIEGVSGDQFRRVDLTGEAAAAQRRGGLLGMASILALNSNPTRTSPVKRGKWIMETLLGTPPPPPPPMVPELEDDKAEKAELKGTLKQRMEQHRADAICASCHKTMDQLGFGLENFDALGTWRERDGKEEIDSSGVLPGNVKFKGSNELKEILKEKKDLFSRCLTEKMLTYALGRGLEEYDECTVDRIAQAIARQDYRFSALLTEIVTSEPFQQKRGAGVRK